MSIYDPEKGVVKLGWELYEFSWGTAVRNGMSGKWIKLFLFPNAQEINVEHLNVILHDNGIEFLSSEESDS